MMPFARLPNGIMQDLKKVIKTGGSYGTNGVYLPKIETPETFPIFKGALLATSMDTLNFGKGGTYVKSDAKVYTYEILIAGQEIIDLDGLRYKVLEVGGYKPYAGNLNIYNVDRVGVTAE